MPTYYICIRGHLPDRYAAWFNDLHITRRPGGETLLAGELCDQGALFGVLLKVRDLGLVLLSVTCDSGQPVPDTRAVQSNVQTIIRNSDHHVEDSERSVSFHAAHLDRLHAEHRWLPTGSGGYVGWKLRRWLNVFQLSPTTIITRSLTTAYG